MRVEWTRPAVLNGILQKYIIAYSIDAGNLVNVTVDYNQQQVSELFFYKHCYIIINAIQTQSYDIGGLAPYQMVTVIISTINRAGTSGPSKRLSGFSSEAGT